MPFFAPQIVPVSTAPCGVLTEDNNANAIDALAVSRTQANRYGLTKVGYTINETIELGIFGSRTQFYRCVKDRQVRLTKRGDRSIVLTPHLLDYLASLEQISEAANG